MNASPRAPIVVMASGVFDLWHRGHYNLLWRAAQLGDALFVGVVTDEGTQAYKGRRPVWNERARLEVVKGLGCVEHAELQCGTDPSELLERWRPDVLVHGDDWQHLKAGQETVERLGIRWVLLPYTPEVSTTLLRNRSQAQEQPALGGLEREAGVLGAGAEGGSWFGEKS